MASTSYLVVRLVPIAPVDGADFTRYLEDLPIALNGTSAATPPVSGLAALLAGALHELWLHRGHAQSLQGIPAGIKSLRLTNLKDLDSLRPLPHCQNLESFILDTSRKIQTLEGLEAALICRSSPSSTVEPSPAWSPYAPCASLTTSTSEAAPRSRLTAWKPSTISRH
jgi:hypothetical protein